MRLVQVQATQDGERNGEKVDGEYAPTGTEHGELRLWTCGLVGWAVAYCALETSFPKCLIPSWIRAQSRGLDCKVVCLYEVVGCSQCSALVVLQLARTLRASREVTAGDAQDLRRTLRPLGRGCPSDWGVACLEGFLILRIYLGMCSLTS